MKNKLLLIALLIFSISCSRTGSDDKPQPAPDDSFTIEGTVVKVFNFIIPSAHATSFAVLLTGNNKGCSDDEERCAFLIEIDGDKETLIASTPVIDNSFRFKLAQKPKSSQICKVIVRGWDPIKKEPIEGSANREFVFKGSELNGRIEVSPETTVSSNRKLKLLRNGESFFIIIRDFIHDVYEKFQNRGENLRETLKRLLEDAGGDLSLFIEDMMSPDPRPELNIELFLQKLSIKLWTEAKIRSVSKEELFLFIDELNNRIEESQNIISDQMGDNNFGEIINSHFTQQNQYLAAEQLQEEINSDEEAAFSLENEEDRIDASNQILNKYNQVNDYFNQAQINLNFINAECPKFLKYIRIRLMKQEMDRYKENLIMWNNEEAIVSEIDQGALAEKLSPMEDDSNDLNDEERNNILNYCNKENI